MGVCLGAQRCAKHCLIDGPINDQQKDVSLFLDETGEPAVLQRDSSRLKNKDTYFG